MQPTSPTSPGIFRIKDVGMPFTVRPCGPSRRWGETPVAFVVLKEGTQAKAEDLAAFVNARVAKVKRPAAYEFVESLPRSTRINPWDRALRSTVADGYVLLLEHGKLRIVAEGLAFANELKLDAAQEWLYVAESTAKRVSRLRLRKDGERCPAQLRDAQCDRRVHRPLACEYHLRRTRSQNRLPGKSEGDDYPVFCRSSGGPAARTLAATGGLNRVLIEALRAVPVGGRSGRMALTSIFEADRRYPYKQLR
jgi:AMP-binding enzyme C-terminal domain